MIAIFAGMMSVTDLTAQVVIINISGSESWVIKSKQKVTECRSNPGLADDGTSLLCSSRRATFD